MAKNKILIIEDDEVLARMYAKSFLNHNFNVKSAFGGVEGVAAALSERPDIILLDVMMPEMDGFSVLKILIGDPKTKEIPVVILTNLGASDILIEEAKRLGVRDYLIKYKTSTEDLVEKVEKIIESSKEM